MQVAELERKSSKHRILAAEDQRVNRQLMEFIFADLGCELKLVSDGKKAIEALRETAFDIVFLDLQMPELDGFLTAKAIREEFGSDAPPIYAVSADLTKEAREQCLKASIVDLIPKPLTAKTVAKILGKESLLPTAAATMVEGDHWRLPSGLELFVSKGMGERVRRILEIFLQDSADRLQRLMLALKAKDWKAVTDITHSLRGSAAQVGATTLANQCLRLEEFTNGRQHVSIKRTMAMIMEFENVEKSVRSYLDEFLASAEKVV